MENIQYSSQRSNVCIYWTRPKFFIIKLYVVSYIQYEKSYENGSVLSKKIGI